METAQAESRVNQTKVAIGTLSGQHELIIKKMKSVQKSVDDSQAKLSAVGATNLHNLEDLITDAKDELEKASKSNTSLNDFLKVAAQLKKSMKKKKLCFFCGQTAGSEQVTHLEKQVAESESALATSQADGSSKVSEANNLLQQLQGLKTVAQMLEMQQSELTQVKKQESELRKNKEKEEISLPELEEDMNVAHDQEQNATELKKKAEKMNTLCQEIAAAEAVLAQSGDGGTGREDQITQELEDCKG